VWWIVNRVTTGKTVSISPTGLKQREKGEPTGGGHKAGGRRDEWMVLEVIRMWDVRRGVAV